LTYARPALRCAFVKSWLVADKNLFARMVSGVRAADRQRIRQCFATSAIRDQRVLRFGRWALYRARHQGAGQPRAARREESPGSTKRGWRVTPAGRAPKGAASRESATESKPPMAPRRLSRPGRTGKGERVRQERTGALATALARQTPPGARPNRGLAPVTRGGQECFAPRGSGWLLERRSNAPPR
jgi:hypothetical protein